MYGALENTNGNRDRRPGPVPRRTPWPALAGHRRASSPEACFVIDGEQRVVQWSHGAATTLGVAADEALGRRCFEVVRGREPFRRTACRRGCSVLTALRSGVHQLVVEAGGACHRFECKPIGLPSPSGGAIVTLVPQGPSRGPSPALDTLHDLAALGALAASLRPGDLARSFERTLDWLRETTGAEVAELFVAEPRGRDMLLTSFRGPFRNAFFQICRFRPGEGFPGLVGSLGEPIATHNLAAEPRFLRSLVKERGFQSYVCAPVGGSEQIIGSLSVAARHPHVDVDRALRLLTWASAPLGTLIQASSREGHLLETIPVPGPQAAATALDDLLRRSLRRLADVGGASDGRLCLYNARADAVAHQATLGPPAALVCAGTRAREMQACPALIGGHGMALHGPRRLWPPGCRRLSAQGGMVHCLPLLAGGQPLGIVQLRYPPGRLSPPTAHLADLLHLAEEVAWTIRPACLGGDGDLPAVPCSAGGPRQAPDSPAAPREQGPDGQAWRPFLDIRCLGSFRLCRQGTLITPDMVPRRGALAVLKILLMHRGRRVPRDLLVELLWPEASPAAGGNRLYLLVHALRQLVEPAPRARRWAFICNDADRYYFNSGAPYFLDVEDFQSSFELGRQRERQGDAPGAIAAYEAAAALYRGDFLEDEPYVDWAWEERERLRETYLVLLARLASLNAQCGSLEQSIDWYRQSLRIDPLREQNHRALMSVLWQAGRRDEALRQFESCRTVLRKELDVDPLPETEQLYSCLRANQGLQPSLPAGQLP